MPTCLLASARRSKCVLISDLFSECAQSAYTALGYNLFGGKHLKCYTVDDELCAAFIRDARSDPHLNKHLDDDIVFLLFELTLSLSSNIILSFAPLVGVSRLQLQLQLQYIPYARMRLTTGRCISLPVYESPLALQTEAARARP